MLIVVARLGLPEMVGQFALAMAVTTPIILLIGLDLRTVQATDQSNSYPFEDFFTLRLLTLVVAMSVIMAFTAWNGYKPETSLLIFVMGIAKCIEALSDLCHGTLQQHERLDQMAAARILRGVMSVAILAAGLMVFHSLLLATVSLAVMWAMILVAYDWPMAYRLLHSRGYSTSLLRFRPRQLWTLLLPAIPTGILSCQSSLEVSLPRLYMDSYLGERELGMYSAVSSLIIASTTVVNAVHCAVLPRLAKHVASNQWEQSWKIMLNLSIFGAILGMIGTAGVVVCGEQILGLAFGSDYVTESPLLTVLMLGATIRYITLPISMGFRAVRSFWMLSILQTLSLVAMIPALMVLVPAYRGMGAAYASLVLAIVLAIMQIPVAALFLKSRVATASPRGFRPNSEFSTSPRACVPGNSAVSVVYVVGSGRCGTTLLDTILSNHPQVYGAGELALLSVNNLFHRFYCPCGGPVDGCQFWGAVMAEWFRRTGMTDLTEHARLRQLFEGPRLVGLSRLMRERLRPSKEFAKYASQTAELYRSIRQVSGRNIIVDSSAIPMRAFALSMMSEIDLRLVHLVRDGRGVAWSLKKGLQEDPKQGIGTTEEPRPVWRSALTWIAYNMASTWVCRQVPRDRSFFCRYEDLSVNSEDVLDRLGDFIGCDFSELVQRIKSGEPLKVGCTFGGNRMRMGGSVRLRLDSDWTQKLSQSEKRTLSWMCGWLMRRYGYQV